MEDVRLRINGRFTNSTGYRLDDNYWFEHNYEVISGAGCKLAWEYLSSDASFREYLNNEISSFKKECVRTEQTLKEVFINTLWSESAGLVELTCKTKEGAEGFANRFKISFSDFKHLKDTVIKGQALRDHLLSEKKKFNRKFMIVSLVFAVIFLLSIVVTFFHLSLFQNGVYSLLFFVFEMALLTGSLFLARHAVYRSSFPNEKEYVPSWKEIL